MSITPLIVKAEFAPPPAEPLSTYGTSAPCKHRKLEGGSLGSPDGTADSKGWVNGKEEVILCGTTKTDCSLPQVTGLDGGSPT